MITQQFSGINIVITDSSTLYKNGNDDYTVKVLTIFNSVVFFIATVIW